MTESEAIKWQKQIGEVFKGFPLDIEEKMNDSCDMAMQALEKEIPKKPIPLIDKTFGIMYSFMCPCCNYEGLGNNECRFARCENCGQKLDWSDTD